MSGSRDNLVTLVKLSPNGELLAISTPESISIYSTKEDESNLRASIRTLVHPDPPRADPTLDPISSEPLLAFARCLAFSPDSKRLAVTGDDKTVRVWNVSESKDGKLIGFKYGEQILHKNLPKRASMIQWEGNETIIVADKFGDVRSFTIGSAPTRASTRPNKPDQPPAKKAKTEQSEVDEDDENEEEEEQDLSLKPHLGHVSFLTSFILTGKSHRDSSPRRVITADRDGHIRVSRWGSRKAAWVTENFLLGSRGCVGSILLIPSSSEKEADQLLLSSDGGSDMIIWRYLAPAGTKQQVSSTSVKASLLDRVAICPEREKMRENRKLDENGRLKGSDIKFGKASKKSNSQENGTSKALTPQVDSSEVTSDPRRKDDLEKIKAAKQDLGLIITSLKAFKTKSNQTFIVFTAEGSECFYHFELKSALSDLNSFSVPSFGAGMLVHETLVGAPILSLEVDDTSPDGSIKIWTSSDTRKGVRLSKTGRQEQLWKTQEGDGGLIPIDSLGLDCFRFDGERYFRATEDEGGPEAAILRSVHESTKGSREANYGSSTLDLYPALLWPKLSPQIHNLQWMVQNEESAKKSKGTKPKHNKQEMRDSHQKVIENGRSWLEEKKKQLEA